MKTPDVINTLDAVIAHFHKTCQLGTGAKALELMRDRLERDGIEDFQGTLEEAAGRAAQEELEHLQRVGKDLADTYGQELQKRENRISELEQHRSDQHATIASLKARNAEIRGELAAFRHQCGAGVHRIDQLQNELIDTKYTLAATEAERVHGVHEIVRLRAKFGMDTECSEDAPCDEGRTCGKDSDPRKPGCEGRPLKVDPATLPFILCPGCRSHAFRFDHDFCPACGTANPFPVIDLR